MFGNTAPENATSIVTLWCSTSSAVGAQPSTVNAGVLNEYVQVSPLAGVTTPSRVSSAWSSTLYSLSNANGRAGVNVSSDTPLYVSAPGTSGVITNLVLALTPPTCVGSMIGVASSMTMAVGTTFSTPRTLITGASLFGVTGGSLGASSGLPAAEPPADGLWRAVALLEPRLAPLAGDRAPPPLPRS